MPTWLAGRRAAVPQSSLQGRAQCTEGPRPRTPVDAEGLRLPDTSSSEACDLRTKGSRASGLTLNVTSSKFSSGKTATLSGWNVLL